MNIQILTLNCQKAYAPGLQDFLEKVMQSSKYDFILLQEVDDKVAAMIAGASGYQILETTNPDNHLPSQLRILYRSNFHLQTSGFISFAKMNKLFAKRGEPGFLYGTFENHEGPIIIGSLHLHPSFPFHIRQKEIVMVRKKLESINSLSLPVIFGGDLNLTYPWEGPTVRRLLAKNFYEATLPLGATMDSHYTK